MSEYVSLGLQEVEAENVLGLLRLALWPPTTFPGLADMLMVDWKCVVEVVKMAELVS